LITVIAAIIEMNKVPPRPLRLPGDWAAPNFMWTHGGGISDFGKQLVNEKV
jgi:hypothetical protein